MTPEEFARVVAVMEAANVEPKVFIAVIHPDTIAALGGKKEAARKLEAFFGCPVLVNFGQEPPPRLPTLTVVK
jgi:hypothetical protein